VPQPSCCSLLGDEAELFAQHSDRLLRQVRAAVNTSDAIVEDACAEAWAILLRRQPDRTPTLFGWLRIVAIREAIRMDRRARSAVSMDVLAATPTRADGDTLGVNREALPPTHSDGTVILAREALRELAQLPLRQRQLFALHVAGYSYEEISQLNGDSVRTVDRQLRRARQRVRWPHHDS
jgi:RNA polymerase sigma factor (sigma-70 family)